MKVRESSERIVMKEVMEYRERVTKKYNKQREKIVRGEKVRKSSRRIMR